MKVLYNIIVFYKDEDDTETIAHILEKKYEEYPSDSEILNALNEYDGDLVRVDKVYIKCN